MNDNRVYEASYVNDGASVHSDTRKVSVIGIMLKSLLGVLIFGFVGFSIFSVGAAIFSGFFGIILFVIFSIIYYLLYGSMAIDNGPIVNLVKFLGLSTVLGVMFGNAMVTIPYMTAMYTGINLANTVAPALVITFVVVFSVALVGIFLLPFIKVNDKNNTRFAVSGNIMLFLLFIPLAISSIGFLFMLIDMLFKTGIGNMIYGFLYGNGMFAIGFSFLMVLFSVYTYFLSLYLAKQMIQTKPKYMEYFISAILINAIADLFITVFRFVLQLLSRNEE